MQDINGIYCQCNLDLQVTWKFEANNWLKNA
jgi:hypothetical protein